MAINSIPGVGPQNTDIATAVSTSSAVSAQITASVPTAAAIATAVAAPSAATIAAAVAAPSSATIATAVAAAVPTTAGITTIVQANAGSPVGGTWTSLGVVNMNGLSGTTFSSLSGYKYLMFFYSLAGAAGGRTQIQFNGDTGSNYSSGVGVPSLDASPGFNNGQLQTQITLHGSPQGNYRATGIVKIPNSNSGLYKTVEGLATVDYNTTLGWEEFGLGVWNSTAAISSVTFLNHYPTTFGASSRIWGIGGN
jgi:hypothetical protein